MSTNLPAYCCSCLCVALKTEVTKAESRAADWQRAFNREEAARQELEEELKVGIVMYEKECQLRIDGECDLLLGLQAAQQLGEENKRLKEELEALKTVAEPIAELFEPREDGVAQRPLVDRLRETPGRLKAYLQKLRKSVPQQVVAFLRSYFPGAPVHVIAQGVASDCSNEKFGELMRDAEPIAEAVAEHISLR